MAGDRSVIVVTPERLPGWLERFGGRHGELSWVADAAVVTVSAADGATAVCTVPYPPLTVDESLPFGGLLDHAAADRRVGIVLVRRGGFAVGVAEGRRLTASKVGSKYVQGRTAAGGWSQQRYARRRAGQVAVLVEEVVVQAVRLLVGADLDAVVGGGDRLLLDAVRGDRRLAALAELWVARRLDVPDPRRDVLEKSVDQARSVHVIMKDPPPPGGGDPS